MICSFLDAGARTRKRAARVTALACLLLANAMPSRTQAFCRESLGSVSGGACDPNPGVPFLSWKRDCVTYRFNDQIFGRLPRLTESAIRQTFRSSFGAWSAVACGGRKPFFVEQADKTTATSNAEFLYDAVNESIVAARTHTEWGKLKDHDNNALALTLLWHDKNTGEILDVDMELNTTGTFTDCSNERCSGNMIDLQNTVTHEAGHLLGLGHSTVPGATMEASTGTNPEITKRSLEDDDKRGYCELMLPESKCSGASCMCPAAPIVPSHRTVKSCGCHAAGAHAASISTPLMAALLAAAWRFRRWRRSAAHAKPGSGPRPVIDGLTDGA
jgi:hypothetical protein